MQIKAQCSRKVQTGPRWQQGEYELSGPARTVVSDAEAAANRAVRGWRSCGLYMRPCQGEGYQGEG